MAHAPWCAAEAFACAAGISLRAAQKALARAFNGAPWNGHLLIVRAVPTRGGASGARFEVAIASLPSEVAASITADPEQEPRSRVALGTDWRLSLVRRIVQAGQPGSDERAAELRDAAARGLRDAERAVAERARAAERQIAAAMRDAEAELVPALRAEAEQGRLALERSMREVERAVQEAADAAEAEARRGRGRLRAGGADDG